jgi:DNA-binding IclR family transcriptional regulator
MIKSLDKGLRILCYLATKSEAGPSEISRELKYGKSTVIRLLQTMGALGFVKQDGDTGRYEMGTRVLELAHTFLEQRDDIVSLAIDEMRALWSKSSETVGLYVREGDTRVCIYRLESPWPLRHSLKVGQVRPLYEGSPGKAFLAYMRPDAVEALLVRENVDPDSACRLRHELPEIRQKGVAFNVDELGSGRASVAAPILNRQREAIAVIFISGPVQRLTPARLQEMAESLAVAAQTISSRIVA